MKNSLVWLTIIMAIALIALFSYLLLDYAFGSPITTLNAYGNDLFDKPSPGNWIQENQILIYPDRIVILLPNATMSRYASTKSMDPIFDDTANGIEIRPESEYQIHVGDIIAYRPNMNSNEMIVHRVIKTGSDEQGWYCITKGDNSVQNDGKVRFEQIVYVTVIIIY